MLDLFRAITRSRIGAAIGLVFLIVIVLAFAGADVTGMRAGSLIGGENVATVGGTAVTTGEFQKTVQATFDGARQRTPSMTMKDFVAQGGFDDVLSGLIDQAATWEWARKNGFGVSDRLIDRDIAKLPAFQDATGKFSQDAYKQFLTQRGLTDQIVRDDIGKSLMARLVTTGATEGAAMPTGVTQVYVGVLKEKRIGNLQFLPSQLFAPKTVPTDAEVATFYKANIARYQRPERRTIRYAIIDESALKNLPPPSDAAIRQRYQAKAAQYAAGETRSITQVIVPTEAAAHAFADEVAKGKPLEAAAAAKGLSAAKLTDQTNDQIAASTSKAVADAVFAAASGKLAAPAKGALGWVVARVDAIKHKDGKTLDQARGELVTELTAEQHKAAFTDLATRIGEKVEGGTSLTDVAKTYGLTIVTTAAVQSDGSDPDHPGSKVAADVQPLLQTAFAMEHEGQPQIAGLPGGLRAAVYDVGRITASAPADLAAIKTQVAADMVRQRGADAAAAAADKVLAALAKKVPFAEAVKSLGIALPPANPLAFSREQLGQMQGRVPAPLAMLFSMSKGTAKKLAAPNAAGWMIVTLDNLEEVQVAANDPVITEAASELGKATGREYADELRAAIAKEIAPRRNESAIRTLRTNLSGAQ